MFKNELPLNYKADTATRCERICNGKIYKKGGKRKECLGAIFLLFGVQVTLMYYVLLPKRFLNLGTMPPAARLV